MPVRRTRVNKMHRSCSYYRNAGLINFQLLKQVPIVYISEGEHVSLKCGLWCLFGMLVFIIVEKLFAATDHGEEEEEENPKQNGSMKQIEIEEIEKLLEVERKNRGQDTGSGICGDNGSVTAKQLYDTCVFNNNTKGE